MLFSIIMPVYRTEKELLNRALSSIEKQIEKDWELFVVDDNEANSEWKEIVKNYAKYNTNSKIRFIFHEKNMGANFARNTGIKVANGIYVAFLDSDDEWDKDYLQTVSKKIYETNADIIASAYRVITDKKIIINNCPNINNGFVYQRLLYKDIVGPTSSVIVKRVYLQKAGFFDENLPARQDYDMWLRVCELNAKLCYQKIPKLSIYRTARESISSRGLNHIKGTEIILTKIAEKVQPEQFKKICAVHYLESANYALHQKKYEVAKKYSKLNLNYSKSIKGYLYLFFCSFPKIFYLLSDTYNAIRYFKFKIVNIKRR